MTLKTIRFEESLNFPGEYSCELGEGHSGEYILASDVLEAIAGLVEALKSAEDNLCQSTWIMRSRTPKSVGKAVDEIRAALAALPSPPQPRKERP